MRHLLVLCVTACSAAARTPAPVALANRPAHTCADAAVGLDRATKGVRAPEATMFEAMRDRCVSDAWSTSAIECFAKMREGDLGLCARELHDTQRDAFFDVIARGADDQASLAIARARLAAMALPVAECDRFVRSVSAVLECERLPLDARVQLGNETADFWSLPDQLPVAAQQRIAAACGASLTQLQQQASMSGCML